MRRIFNYEEDPEKFEPSAKRIVEGVVSTPDDMFSIVFKNTKYLKSEIVKQFKDLPNVEFVIKGGLDDEVNEKYSCDFYQRNTHYSPSELDAVIRQFEKIEEKINPRWSDLAKAKFVYDALAKFIHYENDEEKQNKNTLNLMGIFTGRAICAGYSLIYKEAMDRLGISCRYVSKPETHAWNILIINGKNYNLDLTWDSSEHHKGRDIGKYFGSDENFDKSKYHQAGSTEPKVKTSLFSAQELKNAANEIMYNPRRAKKEFNQTSIKMPKKIKNEQFNHNEALDLSKLVNAFGGAAVMKRSK